MKLALVSIAKILEFNGGGLTFKTTLHTQPIKIFKIIYKLYIFFDNKKKDACTKKQDGNCTLITITYFTVEHFVGLYIGTSRRFGK